MKARVPGPLEGIDLWFQPRTPSQAEASVVGAHSHSADHLLVMVAVQCYWHQPPARECIMIYNIISICTTKNYLNALSTLRCNCHYYYPKNYHKVISDTTSFPSTALIVRSAHEFQSNYISVYLSLLPLLSSHQKSCSTINNYFFKNKFWAWKPFLWFFQSPLSTRYSM